MFHHSLSMMNNMLGKMYIEGALMSKSCNNALRWSMKNYESLHRCMASAVCCSLDFIRRYFMAKMLLWTNVACCIRTLKNIHCQYYLHKRCLVWFPQWCFSFTLGIIIKEILGFKFHLTWSNHLDTWSNFVYTILCKLNYGNY